MLVTIQYISTCLYVRGTASQYFTFVGQTCHPINSTEIESSTDIPDKWRQAQTRTVLTKILKLSPILIILAF